ncbi:MAG TPA: hydantoinase/oxoprolinase family protein [Paenirhodobacter sp.]
MLGDWLAERFPALPVSLSVDISPEIREFERTSTTVLNALLLPVVGGYLDRLAARLTEAGIAARVLLVQSNGGVCSPDVARRRRRGCCCPGRRAGRWQRKAWPGCCRGPTCWAWIWAAPAMTSAWWRTGRSSR